jgi:serine/threonine-protein kinase
MKTNKNRFKLTSVAALLYIASFASAQTVSTIAGNIHCGSNNGTDSTASFSGPFGIVNDGSGNLYIADTRNNEIRKVIITTGAVSTVAGSTTAGSADGTGTNASFYSPTGLALDGAGNLYVADEGNNEIRNINLTTGAVTTIAGSTTQGATDGVGSAASFYDPYGIAFDGNNNLYVTDYHNNEIRKIDISTKAVTTIAGSTTYGSADGVGTAAGFNTPAGIVSDGHGNLYVTDTHNNEVRKIMIATAEVTTLAGSTHYGAADGIGSAASFSMPMGLATDEMGNLFVADDFNNEIRKIVIANSQVTTVAGTTTAGSANGTGSNAGFKCPTGIITDANGNLYVADYGNNEIRMIQNIFTGFDNISTTPSLSVYPNPAHQNLNINLNEQPNEQVIVKIVDAMGREVMSTNVSVNDKKATIDITTLINGTYFACIVTGTTVQTARFIKE